MRRLLLEQRPTVVAIELPQFLASAYRRAVKRLPEMSVILYMDDVEDRAIYVPVEPADPFIEALRTAEEIDAEVVFLEPDTQDRPHLPDTYPDTYSVQRLGIDRYVEAYRVFPQERNEEIAEHAAGMAWKLQGAHPEAQIVVVVSLNVLDPLLDAMEVPQEAPARRTSAVPQDIQLLNPHPECLAEITIEYPYLQERYEFFRLGMGDERPLDKPRVQWDLLREAEGKYKVSTGEVLAHWHRRAIARYTRNLAHMVGDLVAGAYDLAVAGRSWTTISAGKSGKWRIVISRRRSIPRWRRCG